MNSPRTVDCIRNKHGSIIIISNKNNGATYVWDTSMKVPYAIYKK